jgi:hypothetical protein
MRYVITEFIVLLYMLEHSRKLNLSMEMFADELVIVIYAMLKFFTAAVLAIKVADAFDQKPESSDEPVRERVLIIMNVQYEP